MFKHPACLLAAATALLSAAPAIADEPATLETIVIHADSTSASERESSGGVLGNLPLIEAPFSVNVIGQELIEIQQSQTYTDYLKNVPGTNVGNVAIGFFSLRGFSAGSSDGSSGGYLYDGLAGHAALSEAYQLDGFERLEVFKGPSALLNGVGASSSAGGSINYVPKRAGDEAIRSVEIEAANRSLFGVGLDVADRFGPSRQFGVRFNGRFREGEQGADRYGWRQQAGALALDWRATQTLRFAVHVEHADNHFPEIPPFFLLAPGVRVPDAPDASKNISLSWDDVRFEGKSVYGRADWTIAPDWTLTAQALTSQTRRPNVKSARFGFVNDDEGNATLFGFEDGFKNESDSGQVLLRGRVATGPLSHRLTAGFAAQAGKGLSAFTPGIGVFATNLYDPVDYPTPPALEPRPSLTPQNKYHGTSLLLSDLVDVGEHWSVLAGARYARFGQDNFVDGTPDNPDDAVLAREEAADVSETSPTVALMFKPITGSLLYISYAEALEAGGTAEIGTANANELLPPVISEQVEIGAKLERGGVIYALALFDLMKPSAIINADNRTVLDGEQRHRGVELSVGGRVLPQLDVVAGAAYLDPELEKTQDGTFDGNRPPSVPRATVNLFGDYRISQLPGLFVNAGVYHNAKQYLDQGNTQQLEGWTRFDVGARYETAFSGTRARFLLGVENVADDDYWIGQGGILTIANPRTFKMSVRFDL